MLLTAVRIILRIVCHMDGDSIALALEWDIRNAGHNFLPQRLAVTVVREESQVAISLGSCVSAMDR